MSATSSESSGGLTVSVSWHKYGKLRTKSHVLYRLSMVTCVIAMLRYNVLMLSLM